MEKVHKDALRKTRTRLVQDLHPEAEMWDMLVEEEIFTSMMMEYIQAEKARPDKIRRLLDDLIRRGPDAYAKFLRCLRRSGHQPLAEAIEENERKLRGLPVPSRREGEGGVSVLYDREGQGHPEVSIAQVSSCEERLSSSEQHQPSDETEAGASCMTGSLVMPSGSGIHQAANRMSPQSAGSHMAASQITNQMSFTSGGSLATHNRLENDDILMEEADNVTRAAAQSPAPEPQTTYQQAYLSSHSTYRMESTPRGYCLIINNRDYTLESRMEPRRGTDANRDQLAGLFTYLGFEVDAKDNLNGQAMTDTLRDFAAYDGLTRVDSLVIAFLCHGNNEIVYGVDGVPVYVQDVFKTFSPRNCPVMMGKPKLFLLNSCRGDERDVGYPASGTIGNALNLDISDADVRPQHPATRPVMSNFQDLFIAYSTFPGHVSYRNLEEGSWYIQRLVEVFHELAATRDIHGLMTQVNSRVAAMYDPTSLEVQVPAPWHSLTKDWYLNPTSGV